MTIKIIIKNEDSLDQIGKRTLKVSHPGGWDYVSPGKEVECHVWGTEEIKITEIDIVKLTEGVVSETDFNPLPKDLPIRIVSG